MNNKIVYVVHTFTVGRPSLAGVFASEKMAYGFLENNNVIGSVQAVEVVGGTVRITK